ncbi:MAG: hypothetical protein JOY54_11810 [Acidobacteriaceae bacterium]|nr:hypothetical protein [Acidobacteriaceae bacterium]
MKSLYRRLTVLPVTLGLAMGATVPLAEAHAAYQYDHDHDSYDGLRGLVQRTQTDLQMAEQSSPNNQKQHERYRNAQEHLSNFDRRITHGHFDKGDLNHAIDNVKDILDHNTLQPATRDALQRDLEDLRVARDRR